MNVRAILALTLVGLVAVSFAVPTTVEARDVSAVMGKKMAKDAGKIQNAKAGPLKRFFTTIFRFGSMILKMLLGIFALWKAGEIAYHGADRIKDFAYVALAFLLYFMLPYVYSLAKNLGGSFTTN